ncbi:MAG: type IV pilus assembly protein PilM [Patescibacteria group bacterium]
MFGLDISDRTLRLVSLKKKRKKIIIESASEISVTPGIINEGEISKPELLFPLISSLIHNAKPKHPNSKKVAACVPERKSFIKVLHLPNDTKLTDEIVQSELINHIPDDLTSMYIDWKSINNDTDFESVLVGAVPKSIVDSYQAVIAKAKLIPHVLEIESSAIVRAITPAKPTNPNEGILIIDIGLDRTSFIIFDHLTIQFTSADTAISGNLMTSLLMKNLSLSYEKAEKAKRLCGLSKTLGKGAVAAVLNDQFETLVSKIKQIISFYQDHYTDKSHISSILLTGGGANLIDLENKLITKLKIKIQKGDSLLNVTQNNVDFINAKTQTSYTTAIGLALRGLEYDKS